MNTEAQIRKEQLLANLQEARADILAQVSALPAEKQNLIFLGIWSVKDLLAHLAGWDYTNIEAASSVMEGELPHFYAHHDHDWTKYNAMLVAQYKRENIEELIGLVRDSQRQLIEFMQTVPASVFNKDFGVRFRGYKVTVQRLLESELQDEQVHYQQIIDFFKESK